MKVSRAKGPWTINGPDSNLFGLEPHFGCCTANFHQGWPKLTASLWMASADDGLAATLYATCEVKTQVRGVPVTLREETDYPFRHTIAISVDPARPIAFPLQLRIPGWATAARIVVNGTAQPAPRAGTFARIERTWRAGDRIELAFDSSPRAVPGFNGSTSFEDGPLVFALPITEKWIKLRQRGLTADWAIEPESRWAYAVSPDATLQRIERPVGPVPFSRRTPAVVLAAQGRAIGNWTMTGGSADSVPTAPQPIGPPERLILMPYAAPKLRLTSLATLKTT